MTTLHRYSCTCIFCNPKLTPQEAQKKEDYLANVYLRKQARENYLAKKLEQGELEDQKIAREQKETFARMRKVLLPKEKQP